MAKYWTNDTANWSHWLQLLLSNYLPTNAWQPLLSLEAWFLNGLSQDSFSFISDLFQTNFNFYNKLMYKCQSSKRGLGIKRLEHESPAIT